ncbi:hypothetical protein HHK36_012554 [Tetracentron sinense]|uniref:BSD domain-containing protein n=1 Tax=Tetracentron sinense TaxID=13715 RepID=A0A835DFL4_TETSI|nr:hypothetical protein HHK36_012554 [Tetracentron sinense]
MGFFKSVFSDDPQKDQRSVSENPTEEEEQDSDRATSLDDPNPNTNPSSGGGWSFGGLITTFATKSESVLQTYRRDLEEFRSGLKKETAVIREVASRAVKELPISIEVGASVAQESIESVGQAIDDFGSSVWRGTAEIITQGKDALIAVDNESDSSDVQHVSNQRLNSKLYSRFDAQEKADEVENLFEENGDMEGIYKDLVPNTVDHETFWSRYFYRIHKLKQAEDARANLVKRAISSENEEELSWDVEGNDEESNISDLKADSLENRELVKRDSSDFVTGKTVEESQVGISEAFGEMRGKSCNRDTDGEGVIAESNSDNGSDEKMPLERNVDLTERNNDDSVAKSEEQLFLEGKAATCVSCKNSDFSVVSIQPSLPEEEDLEWNEIEDLGSDDEKKVTLGGSPNRADLRKRLSAADEEEDLTWDIEDDDEPVKP